MEKLRILAPCKINLSLDIKERRTDGYHEMDLVLQSISLCDTLQIETTAHKPQTPWLTLESNRPDLSCDQDNLIWRCAVGFFHAVGLEEQSLRVQLDKQIPMMAGLGGGSADGAAVLRALNQIYATNLSTDRLCEIGVQFGADIPFCIHGGTARAQGIGQRLTKLPSMPHCWIVLGKPRLSISTRAAFAAWDASTNPGRANVEQMVSALESGKLDRVAGAMENVFEDLCGVECGEEISRLRKIFLEQGALGARMTGSGSAVFGLFDALASARVCRDRLRQDARFEGVFLAEPIEEIGLPALFYHKME